MSKLVIIIGLPILWFSCDVEKTTGNRSDTIIKEDIKIATIKKKALSTYEDSSDLDVFISYKQLETFFQNYYPSPCFKKATILS